MEQQQPISRGNIFSAMFLVAGTCIGGGMLALPVATGVSGFIPSLSIMAVCWLAMTLTALFLVEVSLWFEEGAHVITMTQKILGPIGKAVSWFLYLFICYASIVAYTAGGGIQIASALGHYLGLPISKEIGALIFVVFFTFVIYLGSRFVGKVNTILFVAMIAAYLGLVVVGIDEIHPTLLSYQKWNVSLFAVPFLLTAFSFQTMVPSLTPYLKSHPNALRWAIIGGTSIAFVIYAIWQSLILGIIPVGGHNGLAAALIKGEPATQCLHQHVIGTWICTVAEFFAFFAIATSFLGMTLGLFDFLADGLSIKKEGIGKVLLSILIAVPTLLFAVKFERIFLVALETSGGFGDSILNGMLPILMIWIGRYWMNLKGPFKVPGGKPLLAILFLFFTCTLFLEILIQGGWIASPYEEYHLHDLETLIHEV
ncbi:amino acid permease [Parachlamydia acanthamoebae]|uniref:Tyrosine-specific transport protein n=1 Tax=Parachlamydia acanthamoebae (strain UV7) TaxID=765952 RepID=F8L0D7_PARAV|nr:aromatic amino acid transport family protein [Parachlamydia acanthamoebae]CCB86667.1 tyrosine-specific transport protein [Parachlamydia acanthamoebae UV-7]